MVNAWPQGSGGSGGSDMVAPAAWDEAFERTLERYDITYASRNEWTAGAGALPRRQSEHPAQAVDADLGIINRIVPSRAAGSSTPTPSLAPTLVVNEPFLHALRAGGPVVAPHRRLGWPGGGHRHVIGVLHDDWPGAEPWRTSCTSSCTAGSVRTAPARSPRLRGRRRRTR